MHSIGKVDLAHLVGQDVGTATLLKELARGGMGAVFLAYQRSLKRQIAIKILPKSLVTPTTARTFQQEAEAAAILSHPNIIPIYEVGETEDFIFFTMQLVKGKTLSSHIVNARKNVLPSRRVLPLKTTLKVVIHVLDGLGYAHSQDIIHRDVKPGNVLIESHTNRPIITDFGVARLSRHAERTTSMIVGTPIYMPPEQIVSSEVDCRADIYAAGIMLLEMLVSKPLFPGIRSAKELFNMKLKKKDDLFPQKPSEMNPTLHREMDEILLKAVSFDPESRYATCAEFREHLEQYRDRHLRN